jgi:hypothetical protein
MFALNFILGNISKANMPHATPLPAKQNTTPARSKMGHTYPSSLERSCWGATYYKQTILLVRVNLWLAI